MIKRTLYTTIIDDILNIKEISLFGRFTKIKIFGKFTGRIGGDFYKIEQPVQPIEIEVDSNNMIEIFGKLEVMNKRQIILKYPDTQPEIKTELQSYIEVFRIVDDKNLQSKFKKTIKRVKIK